MLSVATEATGDMVYIHADLAGIEALQKALSVIKQRLELGECAHDHLSSLAWGGRDLTESMLTNERSSGCKQVHHIKLYGWTGEWVQKHGL
jgi:hypothetical protein